MTEIGEKVFFASRLKLQEDQPPSWFIRTGECLGSGERYAEDRVKVNTEPRFGTIKSTRTLRPDHIFTEEEMTELLAESDDFDEGLGLDDPEIYKDSRAAKRLLGSMATEHGLDSFQSEFS